MTPLSILRFTALSAAVYAASGAAAFAQQLDEVVVTAERRETNLQDTPISISALSQDDIQRLGIQNTRELAEFTTNLSIMPAPAYGSLSPSINIRGIGAGNTLSYGIARERSVGIYIDGIFYARNFGSIMNVTEVESIEVLRGPQGTLFGRNTIGGAISYHSKKASTDGFEGFVDLQLGSYGERNIKGTVNVPLSDNWAAKLAYADLKKDGLIDRVPPAGVSRDATNLGNTDTQVARIALRGDPSDRFGIDVGLTYMQNHSNGSAGEMVALTFDENIGLSRQLGALSAALVAQGEAPLTQNDPRLLLGYGQVADYCLTDDNNPYTKDESCDTYRDGDMVVASLKLTYDLNDNVKLTSLSGMIDGYVDSLTDSLYTGTYSRRFRQDFRTLQQEFQLNFTYDRWNAVAGFIYFTEDATEHEFTTERFINDFGPEPSLQRVLTGPPTQRRDEDYAMGTDSYAFFGQATYAATDKLNLTAGLRYSRDAKDAYIRLTPTDDDPRNRAAFGQEKWNSTDYRLAAEYNITDDIMVYVSQAEAYKAGTANDASAETQTATIGSIGWVEPEEVVANEIGLRSDWFGSRLRVNLTYYDQDWTNRQSVNIITNDVGETIIETVNQPDIVSKGFEADFIFAVTDALTVNYSLGKIEATEKDNPEFVLESVPPKTWTLGLTHFAMFDSGASLESSLNYAWRGGTFSFNQDDPDRADPNFNPDYSLLNGRVTYTPADAQWRIALYASNLLDEKYSYGKFAIGGFYGGFMNDSNPVMEFQGMPRTVGMQFRYNF